jgi:hypothetical protein
VKGINTELRNWRNFRADFDCVEMKGSLGKSNIKIAERWIEFGFDGFDEFDEFNAVLRIV